MKRYYSKQKSKITASRAITSSVNQDKIVTAVEAFERGEGLLRGEIQEYRKMYPEGSQYRKDLIAAMETIYAIINVVRHEEPYKPHQEVFATTDPETNTAGTLVVEVGYAQEPERKEEILDQVKFEIGEITGLQPYRVENKDTRFTKQYTLFYSPAVGQDYYDIESQLGTNVVLTQYVSGLDFDTKVGANYDVVGKSQPIEAATNDFSYTEKLVNEEVLNTFPQFDKVDSTISYSNDGYAYCETYCYSDTNPDLNLFVDVEANGLDEVASEVITEIRNHI
jgi:hypothetical protein